MLNLIHNNEIVRQVPVNGRFSYDDKEVRGAHAGWEQDGYSLVVASPPPEPESILPTVDDYRLAIQNHLDAAAQTHLYDSGTTISTYVNSTNPAWAMEAQAFVAWRDAVWVYAYTELAKVEAGLRDIPTIEALIADLPLMVWPEA